jgi:hypothetical protein
MKRSHAVLLGLLAGTCGLVRAAALTPEQIAARATPSVVLIKVPGGLGSGFVVSADGRVVTNFHVISGARSATVTTADGREFSAVEVMGADPAHDVAVLRIGAHGINALPLGESAAARPGEHIVAIGHPLGLGDTVSDGLVSAVRQVSRDLSLLQISAPISPGSSGGPVFDDQGDVIGISTLFVAGGQNLNFAVPIDAVKPLLRLERGVPIASWAAPEQRARKIPHHPLALLDDCPGEQLKTVVGNIDHAISIGAPLYNKGNYEACYRIYEAAALDTDKAVPSCAGPRRALLEGVHTADRLDSWSDKAWAMRDAFDGVLDVAVRKYSGETGAGGSPVSRQRPTPVYPLQVLDGCSGASLTSLRSDIGSAINSGAPLYNAGNAEACYRIYEGAVGSFSRRTADCAAVKQVLQDGLRAADGAQGWQDKAWALRVVFDGLGDVLQRRETPVQAETRAK